MTTAAYPPNALRAHPQVQRSFTLPTRLADTSKPQPAIKSPVPAGSETLFTYKYAHIVKFNPPVDHQTRSSFGVSGKNDKDEPVGILPWRAHTEKSMASGPMYIYRASISNMAFLYSGNFLHPVMPKSRCWCVDGETIFALKLRGNDYYRIEMPNKSEEDREATEDLKSVLNIILQYETTSCPFKRGFYIELPERIEVVKKPWKAKHKPITSDEAQTEDSDERDSSSREVSSDESNVGTSLYSEGLSRQRHGSVDQKPEEIASPRNEPPTPQSPHVETVVSNFESLKVTESPVSPSVRHRQAPEVVDATLPKDERTTDTVLAHGGDSTDIELHPDIQRDDSDRELERMMNEEEQPIEKGLLEDLDSSGTLALADTEKAEVSLPQEKAGEPSETFAPTQRWFHFDGDSQVTPTAIPQFARSFTEPLPASASSAFTGQPNLDINVSHISAEHEIRDADTISIASTADSFYSSFAPISTEKSKSSPPPSSQDSFHEANDLHIRRRRGHKPTNSEVTVRPESFSDDEPKTPEWLELSPVHETFSEAKQVPGVVAEVLPVVVEPPSSTSSSPASTLRKRLHRRRALSPLPPANILHVPQSNFSGRSFTTALLEKTCYLLLGPSAHLLTLMIDISTRIAAGALSADTSYDVRTGRKIPCSWESDDESVEGTDSEVDGFGSPTSSSSKPSLGGERAGRSKDR